MEAGRRFAALAENERRRREANREIEREAREACAVGAVSAAEPELEFFCACGRADCDARLLLTLSEYEAVHAVPGRFIVAPGHESPAIESVVEARPTYLIVEKRDL
jgi:hypothetical protein